MAEAWQDELSRSIRAPERDSVDVLSVAGRRLSGPETEWFAAASNEDGQRTNGSENVSCRSGQGESGQDGLIAGPAAPPFQVTEYYASLMDGPAVGGRPGDGKGAGQKDAGGEALIGGVGRPDPIRRQCIPTGDELRVLPVEREDPLYEDRYSPLPYMVHRYPNRVLILLTDRCAVYCRHCFRRHFTGQGAAAGAVGAGGAGGAGGTGGTGGTGGAADGGEAGDEAAAAGDTVSRPRPGTVDARSLEEIARYLEDHTEVMEVLLSGGDPLVLGDKRLGEALRRIRAVRKELVIRIASRIPVVLPSRITAGLVDLLRRTAPLWLVTQYNHPRELTARSEDSLARLIDAGIPVLNQTVLLRGVNDDPGILAELFQRLVENRVKPYYLFQGDLAAGTSHFRLPIDEGLGIVRELRKRVSGMAMPVYAVDLPGGGGKVPLTEDYLLNPPGQTVSPQYSAGDEAAEPEGVRSAEPSSSSPAGRHRRGEDYLFRGPDGLVYRYPDEQ